MRHKKGRLYDLIGRFLNRKADEEERQLINAWFDQLDIHNREVFADNAEEDRVREEMRLQLLHRVGRSSKRFFGMGMQPMVFARVAAIGLLISTVAFIGYRYWPKQDGTYQAAAGGSIKRIALPDGTAVILNRGAAITWSGGFGTTDRKVNVLGEAFFEVTSDARKPFVVQTGALTTTVLGTAFNVVAYPNEPNTQIALVRGKVNVAVEGHPKTALLPGQMVDFDRFSKLLSVKAISVERPDAWTAGGFTFNDIPLSSALDRLSDVYQLDLHYRVEDVRDKTVTAQLVDIGWEEALGSILFMHDLHYHLDDGKIYVTGH